MGAMSERGFVESEPPQSYFGMREVILDFIDSGLNCVSKTYGRGNEKALTKDAAAARNCVTKNHLPVVVEKRADTLFLVRKGAV